MQKNPQWKSKVQELFQSAQTEIKRTTEIGKKMFNASKTNTNLNEAYEELGMLAAKALDRGELDWNHARVKELILIIKTCKDDLEKIEGEVHDIKFAESSTPKETKEASSVVAEKADEVNGKEKTKTVETSEEEK